MSSLFAVPRALGRRMRGLFALVRDDRDVREIYGDNPNHVSEDELHNGQQVRANIIMGP